MFFSFLFLFVNQNLYTVFFFSFVKLNLCIFSPNKQTVHICPFFLLTKKKLYIDFLFLLSKTDVLVFLSLLLLTQINVLFLIVPSTCQSSNTHIPATPRYPSSPWPIPGSPAQPQRQVRHGRLVTLSLHPVQHGATVAQLTNTLSSIYRGTKPWYNVHSKIQKDNAQNASLVCLGRE